MTRTALFPFALAIACGLLIAAAPAPAPQGALAPLPAETVAPHPAVPNADSADLAAVSRKLNDTKTLEADFTQVDAQGTATGRFYLERPGGLRFDYDPPRHLLVVADKYTLMVQEHAGTAGYRVRVEDTPLKILLKPDVDLARDADIIDVHRDGDHLYVTAVETKGYGQGQVTFIFSEPSLALERWVVVDPMGAQTVVTLSHVEANASLDQSLFELPRVDTGIGPIR